MGLTMVDPLGAWPTFDDIAAGVVAAASDDDVDGQPGITVTTKTGPIPGGGTYAHPVINGSQTPYGRAASFDLSLRAVLSHSGTLTSCTSMAGPADVSSLDDHVLACIRDEGNACIVDEAVLADTVKPVYTIGGATYSAVKLTGSTTCTGVRSAIP